MINKDTNTLLFCYICKNFKNCNIASSELRIKLMRDKCEMNLGMAKALSQAPDNPAGWTTSVHCSYYAVFQYMKYLLAEKANLRIPYEEQNRSGEGSHQYILDEIKNRIDNNNTARRIRDRILNLRQHRIEADYRPKVFTQEEALECNQEAETIIKNLKTLISA